MTSMRLTCLLLALFSAIGLSVGALPAERWQWPGVAQHACMDLPPHAVLDAYAEGNAEPVGVARHWLCPSDLGLGAPSSIVVAEMAFEKRLSVMPNIDVTIDHFQWNWDAPNGYREHVIAFSRGNGACRALFDGECRLELFDATETENQQRAFVRWDEDGRETLGIDEQTGVDEVWNRSAMGAERVANFYTGVVWEVTPDPAGVPDQVETRDGPVPTSRHHQISETRG
ncbi:MAG: hypothetical protein AAF220_14580, partial [Pseudomonadota bacterium]